MKAARDELLQKKRVMKAIKGWITKNKKVFWKYELSCFYKTYHIRINHLPSPSAEDVSVSFNNRLLDARQKKQLCYAIRDIYGKGEPAYLSSIDVQIDYDENVLVTEVRD